MIGRGLKLLMTVGVVLLALSIPLIAAQASGYGARRAAAEYFGWLAHLGGGGSWTR